MRLDDALRENVLEFRREGAESYIDLDGVLDDGQNQAVGRVVAVQNDAGERWWYVLNVDRKVLPAKDVGVAYSLRWDIELLFKQLKSGAGLSAVLAWRSSAVLAFLYAKIIWGLRGGGGQRPRRGCCERWGFVWPWRCPGPFVAV